MTANKHNMALKSMSDLMETLNITPKSHEDKLQWLKDALSNDFYEIKSHLIAERLMEHLIIPIEACEPVV